MRVATIALMTTMAFAIAACDQKPDKNKEVTIDTGSGKVTMTGNSNEGKMTIRGNDGKSVVEFNTDNAKLPSFIPAYPGAKIATTMTGTDGNGSGGMVAFTTSDSPQTVLAFYKQRVLGGGMKEAVTVNSGNTTMWSANDEASKRGVQVTATKADDGKTTAQVVWSGK
ncbi:MAG: hypothetical protein HY243_12095 [Proteobacteria bacterium]|nr:hypothetical protein [Pseudomonadota bacterium]